MANKLALTAALLLALVAFTSATRYTTIVTTTTFDDEDTNRKEQEQQQCQSQQFQGKQFDSCQRWMNPSAIYEGRQQGEGPLLLISMNPSEKGAQVLTQCCEELRQVQRECRCEAINHAVKQLMEEAQQQPRRQGKQMQQQQEMFKTVSERATLIPQLCKFSQPKQCQITGIST